jgi:Na+/H+ antiporter NhaD/arsenite permease-like protein
VTLLAVLEPGATRNAVAVAVFVLAYALIAARRLRWLPIGRPAGALLGAVLMVALGVLTPEESYKAINHDTIVLLLGMMLITAYLDEAAFFDWAVGGLLRLGGTPWRLLVLVSLLAGVLSAFLVNDAVCLFMTPIVVLVCARCGLPFAPYLLALATSANIGSAATLVGNPQNMIIGSLSKLRFGEFMLASGAASLVGLAVNIGLLWLYYGRALPPALTLPEGGHVGREPDPRKLARVLAVVALVVVGFFVRPRELAYVTLAGAVALMVVDRADPKRAFERVDWTLLVFFCALFVVVDGLRQTGFVEATWTASRPYLALGEPRGVAIFTLLIVAGSNLVSNVPLVLLTGPYLGTLGADPLTGWALLAFTSTIAGNLTLIGSVANIIVAEGAKEHHALGFFEYLRFGAVSTVLVLLAGVPVLIVCARWAG